MSITSARRTVRGSLVVTIDGDEWHVPETSGNRHYDELQEWLAESSDNVIVQEQDDPE